MAKPLRITIYNKEFNDYQHLVNHMRYLLSQYFKGNNEFGDKYLINSLKDFKECLRYGNNTDAYQHMLNEKFHLACIDLLKHCMKDKELSILSALLSLIITITDNSIKMCEELTKNEFCELVILLMICVCDGKVETNRLKSGTQKEFFDKIILIVDNIAHHPQFQQSFLQCKGIHTFKEKILPFMKSKDQRTRIMTMSAMTWLMEDDDDKCQFNFYSDIIYSFVKYIERGMSDKNRRCEGLRISEMLAVLQSLSNIESLRKFMLKTEKVIRLLMEIIESKNSKTEEIRIVCGIFYNMSIKGIFEGKEMSDTIKPEHVEWLKKRLADNSDEITKQYLEGIMSGIMPGIMPVESPELSVFVDKEICNDIFISCSSADNEKIREIAKILTEKGYKVWLPKEKNKVTEINVVKESIAESYLIMVEVSNSYYNNNFCKDQCLYACQLNKQIIPLVMEPHYKLKDWFRKVFQGKTDIDSDEKSDFNSFVKKLLADVGKIFQSGKPSKSKLSSKQKSVSVDKPTMEDKIVTECTVEDVTDWLKFHGITSIQGNVDGGTIEFVRELKQSSPPDYYDYLKNGLKLSYEDQPKFNKAIDKLKI